MMTRIALAAWLLLPIGLAQEESVGAQDVAPLQAGVVKITAKPPNGTASVGTGFIVRVDKDVAHIVTAAHVVAGDTHPKVEFFTKQAIRVTAEVLGLEGDDEVRGLALMVVRGAESLPEGITALSLAADARLSGGEEILVIGFPRNAGPRALIKGNISSRQGRDIFFSPSVDSGHSGGPVFHGGKVVGMVSAGNQSVGRGVTAKSIQDYIEGFEITIRESASLAPAVDKSSPSITATTKLESRKRTQNREITSKDGASMVLIPAGEFWMGSMDGVGNPHEHPRHRVYLDTFYIDSFEVTVARYAKFLGSVNRSAPHNWKQVNIPERGNMPVVGVDWHDADAYCYWAAKRLPTEAEWEKAARGTDERTYPWGNEAPTIRIANFGHRPVDTNVYDKILVPVDSYETGKSPYGLYHMAGNVKEWVADWFDVSYYGNSPERNPKGPSSGPGRVFRGGSWHSKGDMRSAVREWASPSVQDTDLGFRCVQDNSK